MGGGESEMSLPVLLLRYFAHGILFSLLAAGFMFAAGFILLFLAILGLGGILFVLAMVYIIPLFFGAANCVITEFLWFPVKFSWLGTWLHGILMFLTLIIMNLIVLLPLSILPLTPAIIFSLIIGAFLDGYLGKQIAGIWKKQ
jgi:hypothetical protein